MKYPTLAEPTAPIARQVPNNPDSGTDTSAARVRHLFRASLREGKVHPLLRLVQTHRANKPAAGKPSAAPSSALGAVRPSSLDPDQVKRRVAELPHLPQAALRALKTLRREDASLEDVAVDLGCDASLTARVLRLANSPFYGVPGRVASARGAAQVLGRRTLESVLTLAAVSGQFHGQRSKTFDVAAFWRHALASAIAARALARAAGLDEDQAFVAGLLHDIGLLAMSVYFADELDALIRSARAADAELCAVECRSGLTPHAMVGSWIAAHWHFPANVVHAIAAHHAAADDTGTSDGLASCVHVANAIAHALDVASVEHELVPTVEPAAWARVALTDEGFARVFEETETGVRTLCAALAL